MSWLELSASYMIIYNSVRRHRPQKKKKKKEQVHTIERSSDEFIVSKFGPVLTLSIHMQTDSA